MITIHLVQTSPITGLTNIIDLSPFASDVVIRQGENGYESLTVDLNMTFEEGLRTIVGRLDIDINDDSGRKIYRGSVQSISANGDGLALTAIGKWEQLSRGNYNALWSDTSYDRWFILSEDQVSDAIPARWEQDKQDRLYIAPRDGEDYGPLTSAYWAYLIPDQSTRDLRTFEFDYEWSLDSGDFDAEIITYPNTTFSGGTIQATYAGNALGATGSPSLSFAGAKAIAIRVSDVNAFPNSFIDDTGDVFFKVTNPRLKTTTTATVEALEVVTDILLEASAITGVDVLSSTIRIDIDPSLDMANLILTDQTYSQAINEIIESGTDVDHTTLIDEQDRLIIHPTAVTVATPVNTFQILARNMSIESNLLDAKNAVYAVYNDPLGDRVLRTATTTDLTSTNTVGLVNETFVQVDTTDLTQAESARDAELDKRSALVVRARVELDRKLNKRILYAQAGDLIRITNADPTLPIWQKTFIIKSMEFDTANDRIVITPRLDVLDFSDLVLLTT